MNTLGSYPYGCELDALTAAAIATCDGLDGVIDGIVGEADACLETCDPFDFVGSVVDECPQAPDRGPVLTSRAVAVATSEICPYPQKAGPAANGTCGVAENDCWSCVDRPRRSLGGRATRDEL